jgi:predicted O-methyltransferase YrrM
MVVGKTMTLPMISKSVLGIDGARGSTTREYMNPGEQEVLLALLDGVQPRFMVEIGVQKGLTARAVLQNVPTIQRYVGVDVYPDYQFELPLQRTERPIDPGCWVRNDPRFELMLRGNGESQLFFDEPVDVVFIDGDHGYNSVWRDTRAATVLVERGSMIIWHDYGNATVQVTEVLDELHASGRNILHVEGTWLAFERR